MNSHLYNFELLNISKNKISNAQKATTSNA